MMFTLLLCVTYEITNLVLSLIAISLITAVRTEKQGTSTLVMPHLPLKTLHMLDITNYS